MAKGKPARALQSTIVRRLRHFVELDQARDIANISADREQRKILQESRCSIDDK